MAVVEGNKDILSKIRELSSEERAEFTKYLPDADLSKFVKVEPKGYLLYEYRMEAYRIYNMKMRSSDIVVATYPRSGTTWTQELVWLLANDLDYATSLSQRLIDRYCALGEKLVNAESPRFIKTHLPISLLPPDLIDTAKVVYVAQDPRDVAVSLYYLSQLINVSGSQGELKSSWNRFRKDLYLYTPYFEHVKEAWNLRDHPNLLFLFYEDLSKDLPNSIRRVATFLNKHYTEDQLEGLYKHLSFDNFKNNKSVNLFLDNVYNSKTNGGEKLFIRKGKSGGWRDHFDEEMTLQAERWIADNLRDTDLRFPSVEEHV